MKFNAQMEKFCLLVAGGMNQTKAYGEAKGIKNKADTQAASRWAAREDCAARIAEIRKLYATAIADFQIKSLDSRIEAADSRWEALRAIRKARAEDPTMKGIPGAETGFIVRTYKNIKDGDQFKVIEEHALDTGLLREWRELEMTAAKQLGQTTVKHEHSGPGGGPIQITDERLKRFTDEQLTHFLELVAILEREDDPANGDDSSGDKQPATE